MLRIYILVAVFLLCYVSGIDNQGEARLIRFPVVYSLSVDGVGKSSLFLCYLLFDILRGCGFDHQVCIWSSAVCFRGSLWDQLPPEYLNNTFPVYLPVFQTFPMDFHLNSPSTPL